MVHVKLLPVRSTGSPVQEVLSNRCSLTIQNEHVFHPEGRNTPRPSGAVQEFDFRAVWWQQFDDGPHVAYLDVGVIASVDYGDQVEKLRFSRVGHLEILHSYSI